VAAAFAAATLSAQEPAIRAHIGQLGAFDFEPRLAAARTIRRAPAAEAATALADAVRGHKDEFVRFRAFVLLTGFNDPGTVDLARAVLTDRNDRLREAAYGWLERHADPGTIPALLEAVNREQAEFVRPAMLRALAAHDSDERVRAALVREVGRGLDIFRSALIDALGYRRAVYAVPAIAAVAANDGPLQDDAMLALGRIGGVQAGQTLAALTVKPADMAMTLSVARCLAAESCGSVRPALQEALVAGGALVAPAAQGLSVLAERGDTAALAVLVKASTAAPARDHAAVALGMVAIRQPSLILAWLVDHGGERQAAIDALRDGFDLLEEDLAEESFFATIRAGYWQAPESSDRRTTAAALIDRLQF
jgi:HEAT repeat protein